LVKDVVDLDAFTRCWVQEILLLDRIRAALPPARHPPMDTLIRHWRADSLEAFRASTGAMARLLAGAAADREPLPPGPRAGRARRRALERLASRLQAAVRATSAELVRLQGLEGTAAAEVRARLDDVSAPGEPPDPWTVGIVGGLAGGALGGLAADLAVGGFTFGAGTVIGAVLGAMGLGGLAWGYQTLAGEAEPRVTWSDEFLHRQVRDALLRYLAVAHFGRGAGEFRERDEPDFWRAAVERAVEARAGSLHELWRAARMGDGAAGVEVMGRLAAVVEASALDVLGILYPGVGRVLNPAAPGRPEEAAARPESAGP
jgi:hypothetical protein